MLCVCVVAMKTNLGDIVQDDGMHMVDIVVDSDDNDLCAAFLDGTKPSAFDIGNNIVTDTVVMVPSYNEHSEAI